MKRAILLPALAALAAPTARRLGFVASTNGGSESFAPLAETLIAHAPSWTVAHAYCSSPGEITNASVLPSPPFCFRNWTLPIRARAPHVQHVPIIQMLGNSGPLNFAHPYVFADKYVQWAMEWGFDGYLLDAEFKGDDAAFEAFLSVFGDALHAVNKTLGVFLYPDLGKKDYVNRSRADYWLGTWGGKCSTIPSFIWATNPYYGRGGMMLYQTDAKCSAAGIDTMFSTWAESRMEETSFWANAADMGPDWYEAMVRFLNPPTPTPTLSPTPSATPTAGAALVRTPLPPPVPLVFGGNYSGFTRFPSFYFGANTAGPQSAAQLALVARFALTGWGWQQSFDATPSGADGEIKGAAAATALRARAPRGAAGAPDATVVYRQSESLFTYYELYARVAANSTLLSAATLADPLSGKPCGGGGLLAFADSTFARFFSDTIGAELAAEPATDAVFYDGFDKLYGGGALAQAGCPGFSTNATAAALLAKVAAVAAQARILNAAGKVPILSTYNYLSASAAAVPSFDPRAAASPLRDLSGVTEDDYVAAFAAANASFVRFYEVFLGHGAATDAAMLENALREVELGVPFVARSAVGSMHSLQYGAIGFLIAQGPGCYWGASSGWLDADWAWRGIDDWAVGAPLGPAAKTGAFTWARAFVHANASVDVHAGTASLALADGRVLVGRRD